MSNQESEKRIPLYRTVALAKAFAVAASKGKKAKIIAAIQHAVKYDKELSTEVVARIAREMNTDVTSIKKLRVPDLKPSGGLHGRLQDVFIKLAGEMEDALQDIALANQEHDSKGCDSRNHLRVIAPERDKIWRLERRVA